MQLDVKHANININTHRGRSVRNHIQQSACNKITDVHFIYNMKHNVKIKQS